MHCHRYKRVLVSEKSTMCSVLSQRLLISIKKSLAKYPTLNYVAN